jgi:V8-like Glu-specific endopeptidase
MKKTVLAISLLGLAPFAIASDLPNKVIYGQDNRVEVADYPDAGFREYARSTAAQVKNSKLKDGANTSPTISFGDSLESLRSLIGDIDSLIGDINAINLETGNEAIASSESDTVKADLSDYYTFDSSKTLESSYNTCSGERFSDQPVLSRCSGFLVGKDILVTAGHCIKTLSDCSNHKWVFDFVAGTDLIKKSNVYKCSKVLSQDLRSSIFTTKDYAVIKLDREVEGREPLKIRRKGKIKKNAPLVVIGHPMGLPSKIADGASVKKNGFIFKSANYFSANLDTYGGNSGSPVFSQKTGEVEGILIQGARDYVGFGCKRSNQMSDSEGQEKVFRITKVKKLKELTK